MVDGDSFSVRWTVSDPSPGLEQAAGLDEISFPDTTADGASYDYDGQTSATQSRTYNFDENDTFNGPAQVVTLDRATNEGAATFTVLRDAQDPLVSLSASADGASIDLVISRVKMCHVCSPKMIQL
jgi:hypothetical protein